MGIKDVRLFNVALLAKWKWRLLSDEKGRWKDVLLSKYGMQQAHSMTNLKNHSWWWRDLSKSRGEGQDGGWFQGAVWWRVGSEDKARLWEDVWVGSCTLKVLYPRMFSYL